MDGNINVMQNSKNRRTRDVFGIKDQNSHGSLMIHNRTCHHQNVQAVGKREKNIDNF
jgi:hypothetical protein